MYECCHVYQSGLYPNSPRPSASLKSCWSPLPPGPSLSKFCCPNFIDDAPHPCLVHVCVLSRVMFAFVFVLVQGANVHDIIKRENLVLTQEAVTFLEEFLEPN